MPCNRYMDDWTFRLRSMGALGLEAMVRVEVQEHHEEDTKTLNFDLALGVLVFETELDG